MSTPHAVNAKTQARVSEVGDRLDAHLKTLLDAEPERVLGLLARVEASLASLPSTSRYSGPSGNDSYFLVSAAVVQLHRDKLMYPAHLFTSLESVRANYHLSERAPSAKVINKAFKCLCGDAARPIPTNLACMHKNAWHITAPFVVLLLLRVDPRITDGVKAVMVEVCAARGGDAPAEGVDPYALQHCPASVAGFAALSAATVLKLYACLEPHIMARADARANPAAVAMGGAEVRGLVEQFRRTSLDAFAAGNAELKSLPPLPTRVLCNRPLYSPSASASLDEERKLARVLPLAVRWWLQREADYLQMKKKAVATVCELQGMMRSFPCENSMRLLDEAYDQLYRISQALGTPLSVRLRDAPVLKNGDMARIRAENEAVCAAAVKQIDTVRTTRAENAEILHAMNATKRDVDMMRAKLTRAAARSKQRRVAAKQKSKSTAPLEKLHAQLRQERAEAEDKTYTQKRETDRALRHLEGKLRAATTASSMFTEELIARLSAPGASVDAVLAYVRSEGSGKTSRATRKRRRELKLVVKD